MAEYECKICGYKGNTKEDMRKHIGNKHNNHVGITSFWYMLFGVFVAYVLNIVIAAFLNGSIIGVFFSLFIYITFVTTAIWRQTKEKNYGTDLDFLIGMQGF